MEDRKVFVTILRISSAFFTNIAAGYFFALYATHDIWHLINNILLCILCLYVALLTENYIKQYE